MDTLRNTAVSLCITFTVTGMLSMLMPGESWNRFAKFAVRLFLLLCLVLPFLGGELDFSQWTSVTAFSPQSVDQLSDLAQTQLLETFCDNLEKESKNILDENNIQTEKITAEAHIVDEQRIDISNIRITLPPESADMAQKAEDLIQETLGVEPEISISQQIGGEKNG